MTDQEHANNIALKMSFVRQACQDAKDAGLIVTTPANWNIEVHRKFRGDKGDQDDGGR